ncbi:hypothetical protein CU788_15570 [Salmonella enterica]|nr:hypothetical protein [Salmonella enterica]EGW2852200.1 hypothetical protein [Salmonella enterica]
MKKNAIFSLFASVAMSIFLQSAWAADTQLAMSGNVTTGSCSINVDQATLDWGKISTASLPDENGWISGRHFLSDKKTNLAIVCDSPMSVAFGFDWDSSTELGNAGSIGLGLTPDNQKIGTALPCLSCIYDQSGDIESRPSAVLNGNKAYLMSSAASTDLSGGWVPLGDSSEVHPTSSLSYYAFSDSPTGDQPIPVENASVDLYFKTEISSTLAVTDDVTFTAPVTISLFYL